MPLVDTVTTYIYNLHTALSHYRYLHDHLPNNLALPLYVPSFLTKAKQKQKTKTETETKNSDSDTHTTHMNTEKPKCTSTYIEYYLHIHIFNVYC